MLKKNWFVFLTVFLVNLSLRLVNLGNHSLWFDECYWLDVSETDIKKIIEICLIKDPNPPLYTIITHYWVNLFGDSEFSIRLIPAIACSLTAGFLFLLALRFFNKQTSFFISLMFLTSNEVFYYSQEARPYALVLLFTVLSYYMFLSLIQSPTILKAISLGVLNGILFYLHLLSAFCFIAQLILFPILIQNTKTFKIEGELFRFNYHIKWKLLLYYSLSWLTFYVIFVPWQDRFLELIKTGGKNYWLSKPTFNDFKQCVYDFFNSKELFQIHLFSFALIVLFLLFFKKHREEGISFRSLFFALIIGPCLIYLNYIIATESPIFLKRYVLFTIIGFMLLYSYVFSLVKVPLFIKLFAFLVLSFYSWKSVKIPRDSVFDYKNAVAFLKSKQTDKTLIVNDLADLFSYYYDKEGAWKIKKFDDRVKYLFAKKNIFIPPNIAWPQTMDFGKYKDIYYTITFEGYGDPGLEVEKYLKANLFFKEKLDYPGLKILHFENPKFH